MILVPTLAAPTVKVSVAAKPAIEHRDMPDTETIGNRTLITAGV
jgi:hypothetical protein